MIDPECLDPKEVLAHLNSLGYCHITPQQLKDFIHDLTKLIKYEQKQQSREYAETPSPEPHHHECHCFSSDYSDDLDKFPDQSYLSYEPSDYSESTSVHTYSAGARHSSRFRTESDYIPRYHTSFIRSWNLQGCKDLTARARRNLDPVRLYHQYQEIWKKQRIPGEDKHLDLRWAIRNRMVGEEPTPRINQIVIVFTSLLLLFS